MSEGATIQDILKARDELKEQLAKQAEEDARRLRDLSFASWGYRNCVNCQKGCFVFDGPYGDIDGSEGRCEIARALFYAWWDKEAVSDEIVERMRCDPSDSLRGCPERVQREKP